MHTEEDNRSVRSGSIPQSFIFNLKTGPEGKFEFCKSFHGIFVKLCKIFSLPCVRYTIICSLLHAEM